MRYLSKQLIKLLIISICTLQLSSYALDGFLKEDSIYTKDPVQAIDTEQIKDPLREGSLKIIDSDPNADGDPDQINNVINIGFITQYTQVKSSTLNIIKNVINYAL